jgi:predicted CopG family antitoxin
MAVKTITIDMAAYDALARRKRAGESFSDVIKAHFGVGGTGGDLLQALRRHPIAPETVEHIAKIVSERRQSRPRVPKL